MLNESADLDRLFQALVDPARRVVVQRLSRGPLSVSDLARPLPMSLPAVMQHLSVLEAAGLVRSRKTGRVRTVTLEARALDPAERWLRAQRAEWEARLDRLGTYLNDTQDEGDR